MAVDTNLLMMDIPHCPAKLQIKFSQNSKLVSSIAQKEAIITKDIFR